VSRPHSQTFRDISTAPQWDMSTSGTPSSMGTLKEGLLQYNFARRDRGESRAPGVMHRTCLGVVLCGCQAAYPKITAQTVLFLSHIVLCRPRAEQAASRQLECRADVSASIGRHTALLSDRQGTDSGACRNPLQLVGRIGARASQQQPSPLFASFFDFLCPPFPFSNMAPLPFPPIYPALFQELSCGMKVPVVGNSSNPFVSPIPASRPV
jgi:hypothetical protein